MIARPEHLKNCISGEVSWSAVVCNCQMWPQKEAVVNHHGRPPKCIDEHGEQKLAHMVQSNIVTAAKIPEEVHLATDRKVSE